MTCLSASKITTYLQCPRKYAFRYVEHVPPAFRPAALAFGSAIHSALATLHQGRIDGAAPEPEDVVRLFLADWHSAQLEDLRFREGEDIMSLASLGAQMIREYLAAGPTIDIRAVECPFEVTLVDPESGEVTELQLRGVFDLVVANDVVLEIKTTSRAYDALTLERNVQLSAYAAAYLSLYGVLPELRVITLIKGKRPRVYVLPASRTVHDLAWFIGLADQVQRGIESGIFFPNPGWPCTGCEYRRACGAWRGRPAFPPAAAISAPSVSALSVLNP